MGKEFCQIGNHAMPDDTYPSSCYVCSRTFCDHHQGNHPAAGDYVSCPDHVQQVNAQNTRRLQHFHRTYNSTDKGERHQ